MNRLSASIVIWYREYNGGSQILLQDRRNISKDPIEWSFFGGQQEGDETFLDCAIREIREELGIILDPSMLIEIGFTLTTLHTISSTEIHVFLCYWKSEYDGFTVQEGAGCEWVSIEEAKKRYIYPINHAQIMLLERYLSAKHVS